MNQSQHFDQRWHLCKDWQGRIRGPRIFNNQILSKKIIWTLVTRERFYTLEVPQGFKQSMCQHLHVFAGDATVEAAGFANRIHSSSDKEPAHFICSTHFFHFVRAFRINTPTGLAGLWLVSIGVNGVKNMQIRRCNTLIQWMKNSVSLCEQKEYNEEKKAAKAMKHYSKSQYYLLLISGSKICSGAARSISNCLLRANGISPVKSINNTQQTHRAIFLYKRELQTSLWKLWLATIFFLQKIANDNEKWRLTQWQIRCKD